MLTGSGAVALLLAAEPATTASAGRLILATLLAIAVVVVLISWGKINPFLSLLIGSAVLVAVAGVPAAKAVTSFAKGVGDTFGSVGVLVALGAIVGRLLVDSGGAGRVVDTIIAKVPRGALPWAMAGAAALIGLPMFFEIGIVLLIPIVLMVSRHARIPVLAVGIPALAGLSVLHGMVPPHPGPLVAIGALKADLGVTLALGLLIAIPTVIIAGPVFGRFIAHVGPDQPPPGSLLVGDDDDDRDGPHRDRERSGLGPDTDGGDPDAAGGGTSVKTRADRPTRRTPTFWATVATVLLPVVLMLGRAIAQIALPANSGLRSVLTVAGEPVVALLAGTIVAMITMGYAIGSGRRGVSESMEAALPPMAGTLLIIAAGGGFKQTLVDSGVGNLIADFAKGTNFNVLLLGWLVAVGIRLATGSATVSTVTAAGIVAPLAATLSPTHLALLVVAIGSGSLFFSHVNDVGFWLVKQYFGLTVRETILSWSIMETIISVCGLVFALLLSLVIG